MSKLSSCLVFALLSVASLLLGALAAPAAPGKLRGDSDSEEIDAVSSAHQLEREKRQTSNGGNTLDPFAFLTHYGYLPRGGKLSYLLSPKVQREAIKKFQRFNNLRVTGRLDKETRNQMRKPRCGVPDFPVSASPADPQNYYAPGFKWRKNKLTWRSLNFAPGMTEGAQRQALYKAFQYWSKVTPLEFQEIGGGKPDIEIRFASYDHGDGVQNAFDGRGGVLAHAYFPERGDTHFDLSEHWTLGTDRGTDLLAVAAHEFGHALGLGHSNDWRALMAPYYKGYEPNLKLGYDDIRGIQSLYGPRPSEPTPTQRPTTTPTQKPTTPTTPTEKPTTPSTTPTTPTSPPSTRRPVAPGNPGDCVGKIDSMLEAADGTMYIFKADRVWRLRDGQVLNGYPKLTRDEFENPPSKIDAAVYSTRSKKNVFFSGRWVYVYTGKRLDKREYIRDWFFPEKPRAAVMGRDGRIWLLKGPYYYFFEDDNMRVLHAGQRRITGLWPGIPADVDTAVRFQDMSLYFIKDNKFWLYNEYQRRPFPGYPKTQVPVWLKEVCEDPRIYL